MSSLVLVVIFALSQPGIDPPVPPSGLPSQVVTKLPSDFLVSESKGLANSTSFVFVDVTDQMKENTTWDFGDGKTSEGKQVTHVYEKTGNFTIKMKVGEKEYIREHYIEIYDFPGISFFVDKPLAIFNTDIHFTDTSPDVTNSNVEEVSSVWDFGDGNTATGKEVTHKYSQPKEAEVTLRKTFSVTLSNGTKMYKDIEAKDVVIITGLAVFVDAANKSSDQNGLQWMTAFSDIRLALETAKMNDIKFVFISKAPIELSVSLQDEYALTIPEGIGVSGGFDLAEESSHGFASMPAVPFTGNYTPIKVSGSTTSMKSLKYVINLKGGMCGVDIQMSNDKNSAVSGVKMYNNSGIQYSKISVYSDTGSQRSFYGIDITGVTKALLDGILVGKAKGFGPEGAFLRIQDSSNVIVSKVSIEGNSMGGPLDGSLISVKNGRSLNFVNLEAKNNDLGKSPGVVRIFTDNGTTITDEIVFEKCIFSGNTAGNGSAIYFDRSGSYGTNALISRSVFMNNKATDNESRGGAVFTRAGKVNIQNSLFFGNQAYFGNALYFGGDSMRITNSTFANIGTITKAGADIRVDQKGLRIDNSILYSEGPFLIKESSDAAIPDVFCCVVFPNPLRYGEHCEAADPVFVNPQVFDFRLTSKSPCIDAAKYGNYPYYDFLLGAPPSSLYNSNTDIRGVDRGDTKDIGAFEFQSIDPGFFLNSSEVAQTIPKKDAERLKKMMDDIDALNAKDPTKKPIQQLPTEVRNMVERSLKANE